MAIVSSHASVTLHSWHYLVGSIGHARWLWYGKWTVVEAASQVVDPNVLLQHLQSHLLRSCKRARANAQAVQGSHLHHVRAERGMAVGKDGNYGAPVAVLTTLHALCPGGLH